MQPPPIAFIPGLVFFIAVGLIHAVFPERMYGYWQRYLAWTGLRSRWTYRSPTAIRVFGIVFAIFAACMLVLYLSQILAG